MTAGHFTKQTQLFGDLPGDFSGGPDQELFSHSDHNYFTGFDHRM
jgi:hypothetical protein